MGVQSQNGFIEVSRQLRGTQTQCAALCYRLVKGKVQVLLITSRGSGRWILPKGWEMDKRSLAEAAEIEAWEEAGAVGRLSKAEIGRYEYLKIDEKRGLAIPCRVHVFALHVKAMKDKFPEKGQRRLKWFSRKKAAARVVEAGLGKVIRGFDPRGKRH